MDSLQALWAATGVANIELGQILMTGVGGLLIYLAIRRGFEPLLLIPIGFGAILANIPVADMAGPNGLLGLITRVGIETGVFQRRARLCKVAAGKPCPECGNTTMIHKDGCEFCTACGYVGQCG